MMITQAIIEDRREFWAGIAKQNGWYTEPFFVQIWVGEDGNVIDSVSYQGMKEDIVIQE